MIAIDDKIVSLDVVEAQFVCNLSACKGACCVEGDIGAPLEREEEIILKDILETVKPYLSPEGLNAIAEQGYMVTNPRGGQSTPLVNGRACAYVLFDDNGITKCAIEKAYEDGAISFQKPVSCHLYPVRISKYDSFEAVNYFKWDICSPACALGKELQVPVYKFVKTALIRKYGQDFYDQLDAAAQYCNNQDIHPDENDEHISQSWEEY